MADLPPLTTHLLDLFKGPLRDVRFPDADAERLSSAVADAVAAEISVADAEAALEAARRELAEKERAVAHQTERTLAYARVYAADRPELRAALDAIPGRAAPRKSPGRARKSATVVDAAKGEVARPAHAAAE